MLFAHLKRILRLDRLRLRGYVLLLTTVRVNLASFGCGRAHAHLILFLGSDLRERNLARPTATSEIRSLGPDRPGVQPVGPGVAGTSLPSSPARNVCQTHPFQPNDLDIVPLRVRHVSSKIHFLWGPVYAGQLGLRRSYTSWDRRSTAVEPAVGLSQAGQQMLGSLQVDCDQAFLESLGYRLEDI
jgi:hypothetical protein